MNSITRKTALATAVALAFGMSSLAVADTDDDTFSVNAEVIQSCLIEAGDLNFGNYDPIVDNATAELDADSTITVTCTLGSDVWVGLNQGGHEDNGARRMEGPDENFLAYELYTADDYNSVWGNIEAEGVQIEETGGAGTPDNLSVYGRVAAGQDVLVGSYSDTVTATVNF